MIYPRGFGKTRQHRILIDLTRVINLHSIDAEHGVDDVALALYLMDCLAARLRLKESGS